MLSFMRGCGLDVESEKIELWLKNETVEREKQRLREYGFERRIKVAVALKGSAEYRCWDKRNFRTLFEKMGGMFGEKLGFVILGGKDAEEDAAVLERADNVISFAGQLPLDETAAVVSLCDLYIGPSTSVLHMATALRVPSVTLYHVLTDAEIPNDGPMRWGPDDDLPHVSLLPPPGLDGCHEYCRKPYAHCINLITPEQVCDAAVELLSKERPNE